jgi:hypothetical protein
VNRVEKVLCLLVIAAVITVAWGYVPGAVVLVLGFPCYVFYGTQ